MAIEGTLKEKVKKLLIERGAWYYMPVPMGYGRANIPDFLVCYKGFFIGVETKATAKNIKPRPAQLKELNAIAAAYGGAIWIKKIENLADYLNEIDKHYLKLMLDIHKNVPHIGG